MTTLGLPVTGVPAINSQASVSGNLAFGYGDPYLGRAEHKKRGRNRQRSSSGDDLSAGLASVNKEYTSNYRTGSNGKGKSMKAAGLKQETLKHAHSQVQDLFSKNVATALNNQHGLELQCCITYSKPCGCIRKFILGGEKWKEIENPHLHLRQAEDIDAVSAATVDKSMLTSDALRRANDLVVIYEKAAELKKEKCYAFNNVEVEGKTLKELRGMIGLGNGRKRSKKYEDYVLATRSILRNQYALCEKAAQKLLGYSINFLYKKLRTNPSKTSRLVATNKAERASKAPRHLIPLEELREMGRKSNGSGQCCGRNCISRLASQHFDKIENWRKRLEGSGQRVAQEIVAEVLRASSTSLDGQSSFCQNLVHWVTGCSFKKIRRVRDHLKKDPQSLPEHGLKKYWKDKAKKQGKSEPARKQHVLKKEKPEPDMMSMGEMYYGMYQQNFNGIPNSMYANGTPPRLTHFQAGSSDSRDSMASQWPGSNLNNSNNMAMAGRGPGFGMDMAGGESHPIFGVVQAVYPQQLQPDKNRGTPDPSHMAANSCQYQNSTGRMPQQQHGQGVGRNYEPMEVQYAANATQQAHMPQGRQQGLTVEHPPRRLTRSPYEASNVPESQQEQRYPAQMLYPGANANATAAGQGAPRSSVIIHTAGPQHQQAPAQQEPPPYNQNGAPVNGNADGYNGTQGHSSAQNDMSNMAFNHYGQHYYIANGYDGANFFQGGMAQGLTPFVLQQNDDRGMENAEDKNGEGYYSRQPLYIFSPIPPDGKGFTPTDIQNWKQMPLTPIQILTTPYLPGRGAEGGEQGEGGQETQRFLFPMPIQNPEGFDYDRQENGQGGKGHDAQMQCLQTALTPLVVHKGNAGFLNFGSWPAPNQPEGSEAAQQQHDMQLSGLRDAQQWPVALKLQQYPPNVNLEQLQNQSQVTHAAQNYQQMQYTTTSAPVTQPDRTQVKQHYDPSEPWPSDGHAKKANPAFTTASETAAAASAYPPQNQLYPMQQGQVQEQAEQTTGPPVDQVTTEENSEEKEGGIVTPNIIREALNKFPGHTAHAAEASKEAPKKTEDAKPSTPPLEMPKLAPISARSGKQGEDGKSEESDVEPASISTRAKRFSRDRLRGTIDSPNIVLTPFTPLTPSITPAIVIPDTSDEENTGKEDPNNSASSTNSQKRDSSIFLFPPTHVSRYRAAVRLQGPTISDTTHLCKGKGTAESPGTPGPFPVAEGSNTSPNAISTAGDSGVSSASNTSAAIKKDAAEKADGSSAEKEKSPALTLRSLSQGGVPGDGNPPTKIPVLSLEAPTWNDDPAMASPNAGDSAEDNGLNTPTQQPLNTPTSNLNTPTQQLNTPNQDLKTPTESPVKSLNPVPAKRKREDSPTDEPATSLSEDAFVSAPAAKSSNTAGTSASARLRFHCFTPKDFNEGINCSAFRKPSEFASAPAESAIAQRRRRPRKQANPSAVSGSQEKGEVVDVTMEEVSSPVDVTEKDVEEEEGENKRDEKMDTTPTPTSSADNQKTKPTKPSLPAFPRLMGTPNLSENIMLLGNPYDGSQPSLFQLVTPSFPNSAGGPQLHQATPFSGQQVNTPVFLHSATFLTPGGSGVVRKISPSAIGPPSSNTPQIFTFMPGNVMTPGMMMQNRSPGKKPEPEKSTKKSDKSADAEKPDDGKDPTKDENANETPKKSQKDRQRMKRSAMTLPLGDLNTPPPPSPFGIKEGGLQTPSNLKVVTPSLNPSGGAGSEASQVFNFPSAGAPAVYQVPNPSSRSMQRGGYILCTPSKASPTGSKIMYQPCTSPSMANGPVALVPIEMLSAAPKKFRPDKKVTTPTKEGDSLSKEAETPKAKGADVPVIIVDAPHEDGSKKSAQKGTKKSPVKEPETIGSSQVTPTTTKSDSKSAERPPAPQSSPTKTTIATPPVKRKKSTGSPKEFPKPLIMSHANIEAMNMAGPNVQTPTMLHLVSPSQHSPNSPSLVLYPMIRPHGPASAGSKLQSPLSAGSSAGGTPPIMFLQRVNGPGGSSSLLKSALMKNMPVFQFPPPPSQPPTSGAEDPEKAGAGSSVPGSEPVTSSGKPATSPSTDTPASAGTPSAAVSVICGPRTSTPRFSDKLSGQNDPCLSEAAQEN